MLQRTRIFIQLDFILHAVIERSRLSSHLTSSHLNRADLNWTATGLDQISCSKAEDRTAAGLNCLAAEIHWQGCEGLPRANEMCRNGSQHSHALPFTLPSD